MTAVSNSRRCVLMNAYLTRTPCDLRRLPIGPPLVLTTTPKVSVKAWEVHRINIIVKDGMVIAEEFGRWEDSARRIDLLVLDKNANLVVVELKRTDDGGHMELQAIRYAAMVSTMTFAQAVEAHEEYLRNRDSSQNAKEAILKFLSWDEETDNRFAERVRVVLVSADFSKEITTTALWLNEQGLDIRCVRVKPYELNSQLVLDVQQLIPLPEAQDYIIQVGIKQRIQQARANRMWDLDSFMDQIRQDRGEEEAELAHKIYDWALSEFGKIYWGKGAEQGSFGPSLYQEGSEAKMFEIQTDGHIMIRFMNLRTKSWNADRTLLNEYRERLNKIPGMELSEENLDGKPRRPLELLSNPSNLSLFKDAVCWLKDKAVLAGQ